MLGPLPIEVKKQPSSLDVEETGKTYLDNAILKAKAAAKLTNSWTIADDSGLEIDSLGNAPGIFSARLADTNEKKIEKILLINPPDANRDTFDFDRANRKRNRGASSGPHALPQLVSTLC